MTDELPAPADDRQLDPRYIPQQRVVNRLAALAVTTLTLIAALIVLAAADGLPGWGRAGLVAAWLAVTLLLGWHAERWPFRDYACTRYRLDEDGLLIRRGVFWRTITHVPRSRVQHTDVSQGPLERHYGLGTLIVYTAGTDHARVVLPGLAHEVALRLRDDLRLNTGDDIV